MRGPPDRHASLGESALTEVGQYRVEDFRCRQVFFQRDAQFVEGQSRAFRMRSMSGINQVDHALTKRLPPGGIRHQIAGGDGPSLHHQVRYGVRDLFRTEAGLEEKTRAHCRTVTSQLRLNAWDDVIGRLCASLKE